MRRFFAAVVFALILAPLAGASLGEEAACPYDGDPAPRISDELIVDSGCPYKPNSAYNAERATYSHVHISPPFLEKHTFTKTACL